MRAFARVMDRGYVDFERLYAMHQAGAFFFTRAKAGMDARRVYSTPTDRASGVICDQRIKLNGSCSDLVRHLTGHYWDRREQLAVHEGN